MAINFEKFDSMVDLNGLKADIEEAAQRIPGEYEEVPTGLYEVKLEKLELTESKKGDPMVSAWFRILEGEHANQLIFYNQVITRGFQIHTANQLLRSMETGLDIHFESFGAYGTLLDDIFAEVKGSKEFALEYGENKKGYKTYDIVQVFPAKH